jgi:hypothetical protein
MLFVDKEMVLFACISDVGFRLCTVKLRCCASSSRSLMGDLAMARDFPNMA